MLMRPEWYPCVSYAEINFNASLLQYELLETLEFTSDRKKMSIVVRDCRSGKIFLLSKGADEAILPCACTGNSQFKVVIIL